MEEMDSALYHFEKAGEIWGSKGDSLGVMIAKNNVANVYQIQGNYKEAIKNMLEAVKNVDTTQYMYIKAEIYLNVSELYKKIDETEKSIELAKKSLAISIKDNKYPLDIVKAYVSLANHSLAKKEFKKADSYLIKADSVVVKRSLGSEKFRVSSSRSSWYINQNDYKNAINLIEETLTSNINNKLSNFEVFALKKNLALCYSELGQPEKALSIYNDLLVSAKEDEQLEKIATIYLGLSEAYEKTGNPKLALKNYKQHEVYNDSILGKEKQIAIKDAQVKYQTIEKEKQLAISRANLAESNLKIKQKNYVIFGSLGLALVLGLIGYLFYNQQKLKNQQLKKENELKSALVKIENQNKLQEQRLRISRDLHDNIGSQLTFIISSIDNLKYVIKDKVNLNKLSKISEFASVTIFELRDTIWAMNKNDITFEDLQTRISNFIEKAKIASETTKFSFNISEKIDPFYKFSSINGINIYRIIQEAINNSSKYAEASKIEVLINREASYFQIQIIDNGKGFDESIVELGNGILNIKKRAKDLKGEFILDSKLGSGTTISVTVPS